MCRILLSRIRYYLYYRVKSKPHAVEGRNQNRSPLLRLSLPEALEPMASASRHGKAGPAGRQGSQGPRVRFVPLSRRGGEGELCVMPSQGVLPPSQDLVPGSQHLVLPPQHLVPRSQGLLPRPQHLVPGPQDLVARSQHLRPRPQDFVAGQQHLVARPQSAKRRMRDVKPRFL